VDITICCLDSERAGSPRRKMSLQTWLLWKVIKHQRKRMKRKRQTKGKRVKYKSSFAVAGMALALSASVAGCNKGGATTSRVKAEASNPIVQQDEKTVEAHLQTCIKNNISVAHPIKAARAVVVCMTGPKGTGKVCFQNEVKADGFTTKSDRVKLASDLVTKCGAK
jgi:hypothetical protein